MVQAGSLQLPTSVAMADEVKGTRRDILSQELFPELTKPLAVGTSGTVQYQHLGGGIVGHDVTDQRIRITMNFEKSLHELDHLYNWYCL
jgi:hypothetical protein